MLNVTIDEIQHDPLKYLHQVEAGETLIIVRSDEDEQSCSSRSMTIMDSLRIISINMSAAQDCPELDNHKPLVLSLKSTAAADWER